jgi:hypothetical protein
MHCMGKIMCQHAAAPVVLHTLALLPADLASTYTLLCIVMMCYCALSLYPIQYIISSYV